MPQSQIHYLMPLWKQWWAWSKLSIHLRGKLGTVFLLVIRHICIHTSLQPSSKQTPLEPTVLKEQKKKQANLLISYMVGREDTKNPPQAAIHPYLVQWWWGCWPQLWWTAGVTSRVLGCYLERICPFLEVWTLVGRKKRREKHQRCGKFGNNNSSKKKTTKNYQTNKCSLCILYRSTISTPGTNSDELFLRTNWRPWYVILTQFDSALTPVSIPIIDLVLLTDFCSPPPPGNTWEVPLSASLKLGGHVT